MTASNGFKHLDVRLPNLCNNGLDNPTFPPILEGCGVRYSSSSLFGCVFDQINIFLVKGQGVGGFAGTYTHRVLDGSNQCIDQVSVAITPQ